MYAGVVLVRTVILVSIVDFAGEESFHLTRIVFTLLGITNKEKHEAEVWKIAKRFIQILIAATITL